MRNLLLFAWAGFAFAYTYTAGEVNVYEFTDHPKIKVSTPSPYITEMDVSFNLVSEEREVEGDIYHYLSIKNEGHIAELGRPELPVITRYFAVPIDGNLEIKVEIEDSIFIEGVKPWPYQKPLPDFMGEDPPFIIDREFYKGKGEFPEEFFDLSETVIIRGVKVQILAIYPVKFRDGGIVVYPHIKVRIVHIGVKYFDDERKRSIFYEPLFANLLVNYRSLGLPSRTLRIGDGADLLIITPDNLAPHLEELVQWKNKEGLKTKVVKLSDIGTSPSADEITSYIENAYNTWELPPSFVMLVGDADMVPVHYRNVHPYHGTYTGTDLFYGTVDGSDYFPDIYVGRLSVEDADELETVISKILTYEKNPPLSPNWFDDILLAAYDEAGRYFVATSESIYVYLSPLGYDINRQYQGGNPPGSTQGILDAINGGVIIANHRDHGSSQNDNSGYTGWVYPQFTTNHVAQLSNGNMLPVFFSLNCESNWFDGETDNNTGANYESLGEILLRASNGGGIALIGATRVSYSGYNDELDKGLFDALWPDFDGNYPDTNSTNPYEGPLFYMGGVLDYGKFWIYDKYVLTGGAGYPWTPDPEVTRTEFEEFALIGDPTLYVRTAYPVNLNVSHPPTIPLGMSSFTVFVSDNNMMPVKGALVALTQNDSLIARGVTDASGTVTIEVIVTTDDTVHVTVTAYNSIPYEGYTIPFLEGAYVYINNFWLDDDNVGMSFGNGDSIPNPGETIEIRVEVKNWGNDTAEGVIGYLKSDDTLITVVDSTLTFGSITPGDSLISSEAAVFTISPQTPDNHVAQLTLYLVSAGGDEWTSPLNISVKRPSLRFYAYYVIDSTANNNGMLEPGETAFIKVGVINSGSAITSGFSSHLSTNSTYIEVLSDSVSVPQIPPGDTVFLEPYEVQVSSSATPPLVVPFSLEFVSIYGVEETDSFGVVVGLTGLEEDFENTSTNWTHLSLTPSYGDEWHLETFRSHSGDTSYKCGGSGSLPYSNFVDAALVSPEFLLGPFSKLYFWHWMDAETSSYYTGYAYDGGIVELKVDGEWIQIFPQDGYPYRQRGGSGSPFPPETPLFSGHHDWELVVFDLFDYIGPVQLRFRFGTDQGVTREGWYIDDVWVGSEVEVKEATRTVLTPAGFKDLRVMPNPTRGHSSITFSISRRELVKIKVFNAAGRLVRYRNLGMLNAGRHVVRFEFEDAFGRKLPSGVYFIEVRAGKERQVRKAIFLTK